MASRLKYPRIAVVNGYGQSTVPANTSVPATFKRFGLNIFNRGSTDPTTMRAAAPDQIILFYINGTQIILNAQSTGIPAGACAGMNIWPGWWLTYAGTQLLAPMTAGATTMTVGPPPPSAPAYPSSGTTFPIQISTSDHLSDEVVLCTSYTSTAGIYTMTVTRNTWQSTGVAHAVGARVAVICPVQSYTNDYQINVTPYCPALPQGVTVTTPTGTVLGAGTRWADYLVSTIQGRLAAYQSGGQSIFDGVFIDSFNSVLNPAVSGADADGNNVGDPVGGDGPTFGGQLLVGAAAQVSGRGIYYGELSVLQKLRNLSSNAPRIIMTNGSNYPAYSDGMYWEQVQNVFFSAPQPAWKEGYKYQQARGHTGMGTAAPVNIFNYDVGGTAPSNTTTVPAYSFQLMRYYLCATLMTDAFFVYDWGPIQHGATWTHDELDKGAGTTLTTALLTSDTSLVVASSSKFAINDLVHVPYYPTETTGTWLCVNDDEIMTVTAIPDATHLTVANRGNGTGGQTTIKGPAPIGTKVFTQAQIDAGKDWMGYPRGDAVNAMAGLGANLFTANNGFETYTDVPASATSVPTVTLGTGWSGTTLSATSGYGGYIARDTARPGSAGTVSLKATCLNPHPAAPYDVKLQTFSQTATLTSGQPYTLSFWAKGDRAQNIEVRLLTGAGAALLISYFMLTNVWTQYTMTLADGAANANFRVQLGFGAETGSYWFDDILLQQGDPNIWTRDFDNAYAIFNGTSTAQVVTLPSLTGQGAYTTYKRIAGSQDATANSGATIGAGGSTVSVPAGDGLVLVKA